MSKSTFLDVPRVTIESTRVDRAPWTRITFELEVEGRMVRYQVLGEIEREEAQTTGVGEGS